MSQIEQKLVSFIDSPQELSKIDAQMKQGWRIVSLIRNGNYYAGIMEKGKAKQDGVFIPPRKGFSVL